MFQAIRTGFQDGIDQPYEFNTGMTYDSNAQQAVYDYASRIGQMIGRIFA